ncbi:MAG TPA: DICT sensory domain-containing protein [Micromonosporaceae bacterium]
MADSGRTPQRLTKQTLVAVSHAIERSALATAEDGPMVVFGLFQRLPYFHRERGIYDRIAKLSAATVVALVDRQPPELPAGLFPVLLAEDEELAREWSVVALTPRFGAVLVARDLEEVAGGAVTLESGRLFDAWWSLRRDEALHEAIRLRAALADRLPPSAHTAIDAVLARVRDVPATPGEARADAAVRLLATRLTRTHQRTRALSDRLDLLRRGQGGDSYDRAETAAGAEASAKVVNEAYLRRWLGEEATTASGTLPLALVGVRISHQDNLPERFGRRSSALATIEVLRMLTGLLRPIDRAVRLSEEEFLLVLPSRPYDDAVALAYRLVSEVSALGQVQPVGPTTANTVVAVTRRRPLPLDEVRHALAWAAREGVPVATLPEQVDDPAPQQLE